MKNRYGAPVETISGVHSLTSPYRWQAGRQDVVVEGMQEW
ncbi:hypothetical protein LNP74_05185 [Klebsiella pneumoniae subsp. pneumoniae]|nr:hypothetical protein [Klebsiella pneumoniae subsp. pneumoniae]